MVWLNGVGKLTAILFYIRQWLQLHSVISHPKLVNQRKFSYRGKTSIWHDKKMQAKILGEVLD